MVQTHLLSVHTLWRTFMKILMIITRAGKKALIVFDDMIADFMSNKNFQTIIKELFIRCRKLTILLVFITQSYFSIPKDARLNSTHYLIMKINKKQNYKILQLIILQILTTKILWKFTENAQENHILFWQLIQHYQQVTI